MHVALIAAGAGASLFGQKLPPFRPLTKASREGSRRMNSGYSVPRCQLGSQLSDLMTPVGLLPDPFVVEG